MRYEFASELSDHMSRRLSQQFATPPSGDTPFDRQRMINFTRYYGCGAGAHITPGFGRSHAGCMGVKPVADTFQRAFGNSYR
jgi:hypothetical protein